MRGLLAVFAVAAAMMLGGCYQSEQLLLDSTRAANPLQPGDYGRVTGKQYNVVYDQHSWYRVRSFDSRGGLVAGLGNVVLINRAADFDRGEDKGYVFAAKDQNGYAYGILVVDRYGRVAVGKPTCSGGKDRGIAEAVGATVEKIRTEKACRFTDRAQLMAALTSWYGSQGEFMGKPYLGEPYRRQSGPTPTQ